MINLQFEMASWVWKLKSFWLGQHVNAASCRNIKVTFLIDVVCLCVRHCTHIYQAQFADCAVLQGQSKDHTHSHTRVQTHSSASIKVYDRKQHVYLSAMFSYEGSDFFFFLLNPRAGDTAGSCGDPGIPSHGSREQTDFRIRSKVFFSCTEGYEMIGSAERMCFPNGTWSGMQPFCKRKRRQM